jgi:hypothetical protein
MAAPNVSTREELLGFLEQYATDRLKTELLAFWGRHPKAKFSRSAIRCALDFGKLDVDRALEQLVETGLVDVCANSKMPLYSLTANEERRRLVLELASLSWAQLYGRR